MSEYIRHHWWYIAFGASLILLVLVIFFGYLGYSASPIPIWVTWFQLFPLSLLASLLVWLGYHAFDKSSSGASRKGWKIAFWLLLIPNALLYHSAVKTTLRLLNYDLLKDWAFFSPAVDTSLLLVGYLVLQVGASILCFLQVWFVVRAFSKTTQGD